MATALISLSPAAHADYTKTAAQLDRLTELISQNEISPLAWGHVSYLGVQFYSPDPTKTPYLLTRFKEAQQPEEAILSGLYLSLHGAEKERSSIRDELEQNHRHRRWLQQQLGTWENATYHDRKGKAVAAVNLRFARHGRVYGHCPPRHAIGGSSGETLWIIYRLLDAFNGILGNNGAAISQRCGLVNATFREIPCTAQIEQMKKPRRFYPFFNPGGITS